MYVIFQLEEIIVPGRLSSTVAVNRHAQFKPHLDTGSGTGQSTHFFLKHVIFSVFVLNFVEKKIAIQKSFPPRKISFYNFHFSSKSKNAFFKTLM